MISFIWCSIKGWTCGEELTTKDSTREFCGGYMLIGLVVTQLCTFVEIHRLDAKKRMWLYGFF